MNTRSESARLWFYSILFLGVFGGSLVVGRQVSAWPSPRMEQSKPVATMPAAGQVTVSDTGKTFHVAGCKFIHGKSHQMSAEEAVNQGYTACTRCMKSALTSPSR